MAMWICVIALLWMLKPGEPGPRYSSRIVDTQSGPLRGIIQSSNSRHLEPVEIFYGVPYAAPPVSSRRFLAAQSPLTWSGTRLADTPPSVCPQQLPDISNVTLAPRTRLQMLQRLLPLLANQSEDCLSLNIYVPGSGSRGMFAPYAVVVYVHGESFEWNSGNVYDGRVLTSFGHVVFITLNYRLGILGFLKIQEDASDNPNCCFAISDIEAALRWINTNIGAFGGDPSRVTVVGQDTGAALVNYLLLLPSARGLFHRVTLLSGSVLSPWAVTPQPEALFRHVTEELGCHTLSCLQALPLPTLMELRLPETMFLPPVGPWFSHSATIEVERAGDTFVDRQLLLGLTSAESFYDLNDKHIEDGLDLAEKDRILRLFVNNVYSYHAKEIFAAVRNEYTEWNESQASEMRVRDSVLQALSDGHTVAPMFKLAYLHSRRGATTYLFHLSHQSDKIFHSLGLGSVRGDILSFVLGYPLSTSQSVAQDLTLAHIVLRFFTNFVKTGDPNSPGAEPDYENDKGSSNVWDMYDPVKQLYLSIGEEAEVRSHFRGHKLALWLNLVQQLLTSADDLETYRAFHEDVDEMYAGIVRPRTANSPSTPSPTVTTTTPAGPECVSNTSMGVAERPTLQLRDAFKLTGPWGITFAIGCLLLICNLLLFASVYHRHFRTKASYELRYRTVVGEERLVSKSQSAPELTTASFISETSSPKLLKRPQQNKFSV